MGEQQMRRYVFLVGCPRSGTTWLQILLSQHPLVSSRKETNLFVYLGPLVETWDRHKTNVQGVGLQTVLSDDDFVHLVKSFAEYVLDRIGDGRVILEKTPDHVRLAALILRIIPEAWFIHLVRDPRAVTSSLISAGGSWGSHWASTSAARNARRWVKAVAAGREIRQMTTRYLEVRYEDLLSDGIECLSHIFGWLELEAEPNFCKEAIEACTIDKFRSGATKAPWPLETDPEGFYRKGAAGSWREDLSNSDIRVIEYVAGDLMKEFGYELSRTRRKPPSLILADLESAVARRCVAVGRRWRGRIEDRGGFVPSR
jgi:hypothetical protein